MINRTIIQARLCKDTELRMTPGGKSVCSFTVAWSEKIKETEHQLFLDCVAWDKNAEFVARNFKKGQEVIVDGKMVTRKWQDKDGGTRQKNELILDRIHFCGPKKDDQPVSHGGYSGGFQPVLDAESDVLPF